MGFDHNYEDWSELLNIYYDLNMDSREYVHGGGSGQGSGEGSGSMRIGSYRTAERSTKEVKLRIRAKQNNHQSAAELLNVVKKSASNGDEFGEIAELCDTQIYVLPPWSVIEPTIPVPTTPEITTPEIFDVTTKFDVTTETQIKTVGAPSGWLLIALAVALLISIVALSVMSYIKATKQGSYSPAAAEAGQA